MSPDEMVELQKLLSTYGDPTAATGPSGGARAAQAETLARAARASATHEAIDPADAPLPADDAPQGANGGEPKGDPPPVEHYDDLQDDEIVSLLDSLEDSDLQALREYESGAHARPRVLAAIDAVVARRAGGPVA